MNEDISIHLNAKHSENLGIKSGQG